MCKRFEELDEKLIRMEKLTPDEQDLYDNTDQTELEEKIRWLSANVKDLVDEGQITQAEKEQILAQITSNITNVEESLKTAEATVAAGKAPKKATKLVETLSKKLLNMKVSLIMSTITR